MRSNLLSGLAAITAMILTLSLTAPPHQALAASAAKNTSDGAAKGQATEGTAPPTTGGPGQPLRKKLPGRMKSGTLTVTRGVDGASQGMTAKPASNNMMGNHKD